MVWGGALQATAKPRQRLHMHSAMQPGFPGSTQILSAQVCTAHLVVSRKAVTTLVDAMWRQLLRHVGPGLLPQLATPHVHKAPQDLYFALSGGRPAMSSSGPAGQLMSASRHGLRSPASQMEAEPPRGDRVEGSAVVW